MIYWHVERKALCVYSRLKSCSSSEVAAMIEGLLRHETTAAIDANYVDSHGQSEIGFAFTELLSEENNECLVPISMATRWRCTDTR